MRDIKAGFIPTLNSGVTYWRMYNPVNAATRTGAFGAYLLWWQKGLTDNHPWQNEIVSNQFHARITGEMSALARQSDVIVMGLVHTPAGLTLMQGIRECYGKPVVVETDDNILSVAGYNPASKFYDPDSPIRKIAVAQLREADAIITTTPHLKEVYSELNDNVHILPNSIDFEAWGKAKRKTNKGKITIGWMGGATHNADLKIIVPAIKELTAKYPRVEFFFLHGASPEVRAIKGVRISNKFARIDKYPSHVAGAGFDIGLAPLVDNSFNRSKSNLRWLEYSALGIPCVASRVGHFAETIKDGEDALLCDSPEDFTKNIERLIVDSDLRKSIGSRAYSRVYADFNINKTAEKYGEVLREVVARGQAMKTTPIFKESNYKMEAEVA